jgi:predicted glycogen debranching enzyme
VQWVVDRKGFAVLALKEEKTNEIISITTSDKAVDDLLDREWLLTNERGSYSSSTVVGCNTSGYHGLLIGALNPPANRVMALSNCVEELTCGDQTYGLSTFAFPDCLTPSGYLYLEEFRRDIGAHFVYQADKIRIEKSVYLARKSDTVVIEYAFQGVESPIQFTMRPLVGLRDFHWMQKSVAPLRSRTVERAVAAYCEGAACELLMDGPDLTFRADPQWWYNFAYRVNGNRGQDWMEDLWTPGVFKGRLDRDGTLVFRASLRAAAGSTSSLSGVDVKAIKREWVDVQDDIIRRAKAESRIEKALALAADQFIVKRSIGGVVGSTVVAGYPWFMDWGRDAFIALPGLLLETGRFEEARSVLSTFAAAASEGMIPNHFDDRADSAHFNSVDASLWFIHAAFQYLAISGDEKGFGPLLETIRWIIDAYRKGTRFGIRADADGLITAGDPDTQLTWMDARYEGISFTPRWGKAVEINALWHNALSLVRRYYSERNPRESGRFATMERQVAESFGNVFWNAERGYLNDIVLPEGRVDASLRPNQILAVSLPFAPPMNRARQRAVVDVVQYNLLTPFGLRTLEPADRSYRGRYEGPQRIRDAAYHQGTVWPWLIGPFVEAYLRVYDFSPSAKEQASGFIEPLLQHLICSGCLGSVSEIFDGSDPQQPHGCHAQAWSVGELFRVYRLIRMDRPKARPAR